MDGVSEAGTDQAWSASVERVVRGHRAGDPREVASRERFLVELARLDRPWDEVNDPVHVTASALVVGRRGTVLHRHRRLGRWLQPGGHIDADETPAEAALREAHEETGLRVVHPPAGPTMIHVDVHQAAEGHTHLDLRYILIGEDLDPHPLPGESPEARWCTWDEADQLADPALIGGLREARRRWERHQGAWAGLVVAAPSTSTTASPDAPGRVKPTDGIGDRHAR